MKEEMTAFKQAVVEAQKAVQSVDAACQSLANIMIKFGRQYKIVLLQIRYKQEIERHLRYFQPKAKEALHSWEWLNIRW